MMLIYFENPGESIIEFLSSVLVLLRDSTDDACIADYRGKRILVHRNDSINDLQRKLDISNEK